MLRLTRGFRLRTVVLHFIVIISVYAFAVVNAVPSSIEPQNSQTVSLLQEPATTIVPATASDSCLYTFEDFAYFYESNLINLPYPGRITPLPPWERIIPPVPSGFGEPERVSWYGKPITRLDEGLQELWFTGIGVHQGSLSGSPIIGAFRPSVNEWRFHSGRVVGTSIDINELHIAPDGSIWGEPSSGMLPVLPQNANDIELAKSGIPLVAMFNEVTGQFESPPGILDVPAEQVGYTELRTGLIAVRVEIEIDQEGSIWIFLWDGGIFRYDPQSNVTEKVFDLGGVYKVFKDPDGNFYFPGKTSQTAEFSFFRLSPKTKRLETFSSVPQEASSVGYRSPSLFDDRGNSWFGALGYQSPDGTWHQIAPELKHYKIALDYVSSDGRAWYSYSDEGPQPRGRAWYDPIQMTGCVFANFAADTGGYGEDFQGNLWLTYGSSVYRLKL